MTTKRSDILTPGTIRLNQNKVSEVVELELPEPEKSTIIDVDDEIDMDEWDK